MGATTQHNGGASGGNGSQNQPTTCQCDALPLPATAAVVTIERWLGRSAPPQQPRGTHTASENKAKVRESPQ